MIKKNNTNLSVAIQNSNTILTPAAYYMDLRYHQKKQEPESESINTMLDALKYENDQKISEIKNKKNGFWSYLPPIPALIFGSIGIFLATFITNFANICYEKTLTFLYCYIKKIWQLLF